MSQKQARLLEGKFLASEIREQIKKDIESFAAKGKPRPSLLSIQAAPDPSADWYIGQQQKAAEKLGIDFEWIKPGSLADEAALIRKVREASASPVTGIFVAMPLPKEYNADEVLLAMDPKKDVEGVHPTSLGLIVLRKARLIPPTAYAAFQLIKSTGIPLRGKKAAIVGQSAIVGRPVQMLLGQERVTTVVCNTGTSEEDLERSVAESDIVVACAGCPRMVKGAWIRPGATVIDVGTTEVEGKLVGDVEFEPAAERAEFITPVPGGVGPLTVTMLMQNLVNAYKWQHGL